MAIKMKLTKNHLYLTPSTMWASVPLEVFLLIPQTQGYLERWVCSIQPVDTGKSVSVLLPPKSGEARFECDGVRIRATALPESTGRTTIEIAREQDPPQPPQNRRPPVDTLHLERRSVGDPINLSVDCMVEVEP